MVLELVPLNPEALKARVMLVATLWERLVKVTRPATAVRLVVPCKVPLPIPLVREAVTAELLLLVQKLPNRSCKRMTGCWAKGKPPVAVAEGWVLMASLLAAPGTSRNEPSFTMWGSQ